MRSLLERALALLGLIAASPFLAGAVILIRLDSPGAAIFRQERVGRDRKPFVCYKLWNVVRGEMAFVGPRPCLPSQTELVQEREIRGVYGIIPGITGLGQVRGIDMSEPVRLAEIDAEYLQTRSLALDLRLVWETVRGGGSGDRVKST